MPFASTQPRAAWPIAALAAAALAAAALAVPTLAAAGVPSAASSTVPGCLHASPDGSLITVIVIRDVASNPVASSTVVLDYSQCTDFEPCAQLGPPGDDYVLDAANSRIIKTTNASGQAIFHLRAGGGCQVYPIRVLADGVLMGSRPAASTDQNGDHVVDPADVAILQAKVGTSDLTGDLDCDGVVDSYDVSIQDSTLGSDCLDPTPARRQTWGTVKLIYR